MSARPSTGLLALLLAMSTFSPIARTALAQSRGSTMPLGEHSGRPDHRFRYMLGGAAIGGLLSLGYYHLSDQGRNAGRCGPFDCALPYLSVSGALSGLFMAREKAAERRATTPRIGEVIEFASTSLELPAGATDIVVRDSIVVAATDSGAQVLTAAPRPVALRRRGAGLSNIRSVAIAGTDARLLLGTATALWETPLTAGVLTRVMDGPVDALGARGDVVVAAFGNKVRVRHAVAGVVRIDSVTVPAMVTSTTFDATTGRWWLTGDSLLLELAIADGTPTVTERARFQGEGRAVATSADWIAVALGSDGLALWPRTSLGAGGGVTSPILLRGEPRFAFDLAFLGDALFVAGGVDGITRVELVPVPRVAGSSRQAGYATTITADEGVLWVGDRNANRVLRIVP